MCWHDVKPTDQQTNHLYNFLYISETITMFYKWSQNSLIFIRCFKGNKNFGEIIYSPKKYMINEMLKENNFAFNQ